MKTALALAAALTAAAAAPALAAPRDPAPMPSVLVTYTDLNLNTAHDAGVMLKRIRHAAAQACSQAPSYVGNDPETIERATACYRQSLARAVAGLNAPKVTEAYTGRPADQQVAGLR